MRGSDGVLCSNEKKIGIVWKVYIERIMNGGNDWDHNVENDWDHNVKNDWDHDVENDWDHDVGNYWDHNVGNYWDHNVEADAVEVTVECVCRIMVV